MKKFKNVACWFRRDLRLHDHHALSVAENEGLHVFKIFIFDSNIISKLPADDQRLNFIKNTVTNLNLIILHGDPKVVLLDFCIKNDIEALYFNRDYEPYAKERDFTIKQLLSAKKIHSFSFKDLVLFEKEEIKNLNNEMYRVFTPYKKAWLYKLDNELDNNIPQYKCVQTKNHKLSVTEAQLELQKFINTKLSAYHKTRDYPYLDGTSKLSTFLRFGLLSTREVMIAGLNASTLTDGSWLNELIWREFYFLILDAFPYVEQGPFKPNYKNLKWSDNADHFEKWCRGETGYPIIDSAMRDLNTSGFMPNRLRMVVASFLTKILHISWQKGEAYFALKLLDFDLSANNGGWQWCASTGVDACPSFRIFNPYTQSKKFDPDGVYIKKHCPELRQLSGNAIHEPHRYTVALNYPFPIVDYKTERENSLNLYRLN